MTQASGSYRPLDGYRVVDLTHYVAGPVATQQLAELGAEVLKIEFGPSGDPTRALPFSKGGTSATFVQHNRGKKSICIDLRTAQGQQIVKDLVKSADVLVENYSPGVVNKFGLDYKSVQEINPQIIMCSLSAYGQTGPLSQSPGLDWVGGAWSGVLDLMGAADGPPMPVTFGMGDIATGAHGASAIIGALLFRERTGRGQYLDISLLDSYAYMLDSQVANLTVSGSHIVPKRSGGRNEQLFPVGAFKARDRYFVIMVVFDAHFVRLCEAMGQPDLARDPRFATNVKRVENHEALTEIITGWLQSFSNSDEVARLFVEARVPAAPVLELKEAIAQPHLRERGTYRKVHDPILGDFDIPGMPFKSSIGDGPAALTAPRLGEHTREVLETVLGYDNQTLERLASEHVVVV